MSNVKAIDGTEFVTNIEQNNEFALVDFYADWCAPCKAIAPLLNALVADYANKLKFYKFDVDKGQQVAEKYGVRGIPTLIIFKDGQLKDTLVGAVNKESLIKFIEKNI